MHNGAALIGRRGLVPLSDGRTARRLHVHIDLDVAERVERLAQRERITLAAAVERTLRAGLDVGASR